MDGKKIELRAIPLFIEQIVPDPLDKDVPRVNWLEHTYEDREDCVGGKDSGLAWSPMFLYYCFGF